MVAAVNSIPQNPGGGVSLASPATGKPFSVKYVLGFAGLWVVLTVGIELGFGDMSAMLSLLILASYFVSKGKAITNAIDKVV